MTTSLVHRDTTGGLATITLDSPHNRNALSSRLTAELGEHLTAAGQDAGVHVVLLRSSGRVFCSGADLAEARQGRADDGPRAIVGLQHQIATLPKPVVVELAGPVRAGGLGLVGAADIVIAAASVTFALTEVRLGLAPSVISLSLLARLSPRAVADVFLSGRTFDAAEAAAVGLVTRCVPDDELAAAVGDTITELRKGSPQGLAETKRLVNGDLVARIDRDGEEAARRSAALFASPEAQHAVQAFLSRSRS
ncbi:enoyl-CoA hydratase [Actinoplanes philippinensis]|uniref:Enoyl-CoA hydratase/methylglutaconyl-CoA hydratase n=1 Tax=Actinoplanes philippinensis TaxID=35752 RepID=A0A1I2FYX2_9ACTN|nr:enoyl-CoA hydratase-related protein [Actinoplanes philippinensis]GIE76462.1 enoyl-CoA hydratase [Actinoplanes philippinensis]SFF10595.1 enoyl-CoA hydratase/methylglutaconyl-CoA hydratase [Actinoplanes philippinensis]